jgi:hypothetical protein
LAAQVLGLIKDWCARRESNSRLQSRLNCGDWTLNGLIASREVGWVSLSLLKQKNPLDVGQWIGGHVEIHAPTGQVRRENRHDPT